MITNNRYCASLWINASEFMNDANNLDYVPKLQQIKVRHSFI